MQEQNHVSANELQQAPLGNQPSFARPSQSQQFVQHDQEGGQTFSAPMRAPVVDLTGQMPGFSGHGQLPADRPALPLHVQKLQRIFDLNPFLNQLETLMSSSIKVPADSIPHNMTSSANNKPQNVFSVTGIWNSDEERQKDVGAFYNFNNVTKKRKWLRSILLEESDSDSEGETITEQDLKALLKIHRCRRKYQKQYHSDILNSQYTYYGAGLLSDNDRFPSHQKFVQDQYGFMDFAAPSEPASVPTKPQPVPKPTTGNSVDARINEAVNDVVDSIFPTDSDCSSDQLKNSSRDIVAAIVDSAHHDAMPSSTHSGGSKKKKSAAPKQSNQMLSISNLPRFSNAEYPTIARRASLPETHHGTSPSVTK